MAKRLYMTNADYATIALSPALVMLLVGSLVFFLIEVLYVGAYEARLMYVFALFVFAAVLVARIAIESGSEYASLFALPLGLAMFAVLGKFVEHPSPFSWLINIALMCVVWWCAHKLTWDCTLIDDDEDSSGEGLMQRIGVDEEAAADSELLADNKDATPWWRRMLRPKPGKHTPGVWVLYFSLAALPLFGIGQHWVPAADVGRRRFVFSLLLVYVASALALLVTTSFLGLRRYLRQRRIEMPGPMAANWIGIGAVLIAIVMLLAALIPRPHAEYAISQVPWQVKSPDGLSSSRLGAGRDGSQESDPSGQSLNADAPQGDAVQEGAKGDPAESDEGKPSGEPGGDEQSEGKASGEEQSEDSQSSSQTQGESGEQTAGEQSEETKSGGDGQQVTEKEQPEQQQAEGSRTANAPLPEHAADEKPFEIPKISPPSLSGLAGPLKLLFYVVVAILAAVFIWRNRHALAQAVRDILRQLREFLARLFGARTAANQASEVQTAQKVVRYRSFSEFRDPFSTGDQRRMPPEELVRYTFEAFEAWARDAGHPRSPDQTPAELVHAAVEPQTPLYEQAHRMTQLYSEAAYAAGSISPTAAENLRELWSLMRGHSPRLLSL